MNYIQRRNILRNTSFLDLRPVRISEFENKKDGLVTLLVPKFRGSLWKKFLIPRNKSAHFKVNFDELGSEAWLLIDGKVNVKELCNRLTQKLGDKLNPSDESETRIMKFLSQLYDKGYITFREIQGN